MHWTYRAMHNQRAVVRGQKTPYPEIVTARAEPKGIWFIGPGGARCHMFDGAAIVWDPNGNAKLGTIAKCGMFFPSVFPHMEPPVDSEECDDCLLMYTVSHVVYRLFDKDGALLYVGFSSSFAKRLQTHTTQTKWWPQVADWRLEFHESETSGRSAERSAIFRENPRYNVAGKPRHLRVAA